jgi:nucleotide-binding universal stress UspA family protein
MVRILLATDGSPHARRAAALAGRLVRELRQAEVVLVNVGHIPTIALGGSSAGIMVDSRPLDEEFEKAGREILDETAGLLHGIDVPIQKQYRRGEPGQEILAAADEVKADLIILGSRGFGKVGGLILGSVSEHVLHGAHIPVLIVR